MNIIARIFTARSIPKWAATATVTLGLLVPLSASANHERNQTVDILLGAAVAYALFEVAGGFDDNRHHHRYKRHGYHHDRHYRNDRYRKHYRHANANRHHKRHDSRGYRNKHHKKHHNKHRRHGNRYYAYHH